MVKPDVHIGLLQCGEVHPSAQSCGGDYPDLFANLLGDAFAVTTFRVDAGELPATAHGFDGFISSPSRASVVDGAEWLEGFRSFAIELIDAQIPYLGVCFGHQVLAQALGGRVERAAVGWSVGALDYQITGDIGLAGERIRLIASHEDQVVIAPPDAEVWLTHERCPIAGLRYHDRCVTVQPHPEFSAEISSRLTNLRRELIGATTADTALASLADPPEQARVAEWMRTFLSQ